MGFIFNFGLVDGYYMIFLTLVRKYETYKSKWNCFLIIIKKPNKFYSLVDVPAI